MWTFLKTYTQWLVAGLLLGIAFLHPMLWWGTAIGLVLTLYLVRGDLTSKQVVWGGVIVGTTKMLCVLSWGWSMEFGDLLAVTSAWKFYVLVVSLWLALSLLMGATFSLVTFMAWYLKSSPWRWLFVPSALVMAEVLSSFFFGLFMLGPNSALISFDFSFGYLGYTLAHHPWLGQLAVIAGVYALSVTVVVMAMTAYHYLSRTSHPAAMTSLLLLMLVTSAYVPLWQAEHQGQRVASIYTAYVSHEAASKEVRVRDQAVLRSAINAGVYAGATNVLLPETAGAVPEGVGDILERDQFESATSSIMVLDSTVVGQGSEPSIIEARYHALGETETTAVHKQYLLPYGEYLPYHTRLFARLFDSTAELNERTTYRSGPLKPTDTIPDGQPAVLFCSESLSPWSVHSLQKEDVPFIAHLVSHGWFKEPHVLWNQLDMMLMTHARFGRVPIIQAGNLTVPRAYDSRGLHIEPEVVFTSPRVITVVYEF